MKRTIEQKQHLQNKIRIGVDYYPEQWEEALWEKDAEQMKAAGVEVVRMAEFAWSRLEPEEGRFDFEWLDRAVQLFEDRQIQVILCTPTCTPPLWSYEKYPETIQKDKNGNRIPIGIRGHRCMNSPIYRTHCERIIRQLVTRYQNHPSVIGYQIDNELEANHCRCEVCQTRFQEWIKKKYKTVQAVNAAYGNTVWSGEYSSFSQVKPPMGEFIQWQNPSLTLDYNRYASDSTIEYLEFQRECILSIDENALITTNHWLCENMPDFGKMFQNLDFVSYDNYPVTKLPQNPQELYSHGFHLDLMRGIKRQNFWIMEQLSGPVGSWMPMSQTLRPGMLKGYALQAIAHGADTVVHFRWRTGISGAEMFWHGILDHSNVPGRRYQEFVELCDTVKGLQQLEGSVVVNRVALLYGSDQEYGFKLQHQAEGLYYLEQLKSLHDAFASLGIGVDIIDEGADLSAYSVVLAPTIFIADKKKVDNLYRFAAKGGTVVLTNRSGVKDVYNKCIAEALPTVFSKLVGAHVTEYDVIGSQKKSLQWSDPQMGRLYEEVIQNKFKEHFAEEELVCADGKIDAKNCVSTKKGTCTQWCDLLELDGASCLAAYDEEFYKGTPAITHNTYQKGYAYYLGTVLDRGAYIALARKIAQEQKLSYIPDLPLGVEVTYRKLENRSWCFVFNNTNVEQEVCVHEKSLRLKAFDMEIFELTNAQLK